MGLLPRGFESHSLHFKPTFFVFCLVGVGVECSGGVVRPSGETGEPEVGAIKDLF